MSLQIPDYQIARPLSLIDALEERSRLDQAKQQQKLNEMKLRAAQEEMDRDAAFRGAFSNGSPSPADLYRIDPEKAAQYEKNQLGIQSGTREFIKGAATDLYNRAKLIQDPAQQQAAIDRYIQPLKPQLQRMGLPMNEPVTMDHLKMILGQTPEESQQANINAKIAEKQGLFPYEIAETEAKAGAQLQKAKTLADYEHGLKMQENQSKPLTEFQQYQIEEKKAKQERDKLDAVSNIDDTINDFERLKAIQERTTTGPVVGSAPVVAIRKALPGNIAGGEDLQRLEKGYNTLAVKAIGAFKAGGVTFGQLSNAEGQWIKSTQASLDAGKEINQEQLDEGLRLLRNRKDRIEKSGVMPKESLSLQFKSPDEVKAAIRAGVIDINTAKDVLRSQFGME